MAMGLEELTPKIIVHLFHIKNDWNVSLNWNEVQRSIGNRGSHFRLEEEGSDGDEEKKKVTRKMIADKIWKKKSANCF